MRRITVRAFILVLITLAAATQGEGQSIIKKMKERTRQQAVGRANRAADEAVDSAASAVEKAARCLISDAQCIKAAQEAGQPILVTAPDGQPVSSADSAAAIAAAGGGGTAPQPTDTVPSQSPPADTVAVAPGAPPGDDAYVPFETDPTDLKQSPPSVIAAADFSTDAIGSPPQSVMVEAGTFTVEEHEVEDGRWLTGKERGGGSFFLPLPQKLAAVFTLTFDVIGRGGFIGVHPSGLTTGAHALVETSGIGFINDGKKNTKGVPISDREAGVIHHVRIVGRDSTLTLFIDDTKVAEATSSALGRRGKRIAFGMSVYGSPERIGAIRLVEGAE